MIHHVAVNRTVHSAWTDGSSLVLLFTDGTELIAEWGLNGPELKGRKSLASLPAVSITDGVVSSQLVGKVIEVAHTDGPCLYLRTRCHHECVIEMKDAPVIRSMNVRIPIPSPAASLASAWGV